VLLLNFFRIYYYFYKRIAQWPSTNIEEFIWLNEAFNTIINRNVGIYKRQKEFVENASHELQTPLAAFQAKLDTLMQMSGISSSQSAIIDDLLHMVLRLTRLNKNLLLLSKLDRNMFPETEEILLNKALLRQLTFFIQQAEIKGITLEYKFINDLFVIANTSLLDSLLSNLLLNAIRYNYPGGNVKVIIEGRTLSIQNTGKDEVLDTYRIFERFAKSDSNSKGNGLGLAIMKKIATFYTWQLDYCKCNEYHCFILKF
jgi:signal transduction histidine kinase